MSLCRVHFYNIPVTDDLTQAAHPLNMIRNICQPGDFIAVKLDIDNGPLETAIIDEIQADEHLSQCISELFYEQHYNHPGVTAIVYFYDANHMDRHHQHLLECDH